MTLGVSRRVWLGLALVVLATAAGIALPRIHRTALLGSGFMAQTLCEGVFISGREPQSLLDEELTGKGYELLVFFQPKLCLCCCVCLAQYFLLGLLRHALA